jgi:competence protein ComFC
VTIEIGGNWKKGFALDLHTIRSEYAGDDEFGHPRFNTVRTETGELVYKLKYRNDEEAVGKLVLKIKEAIRGLDAFDCIIPIPPSNKVRPKQPVLLVARALSDIYGIPAFVDALEKKSDAGEMKNVQDRDERMKTLKSSLVLNPSVDVSAKKIILLDDLYRSGTTLTVATSLLYDVGRAAMVCVLALTKTRSNR